MLVIGICGASGSGKSTLARELEAKLDKRCVYLKQDSYYKDHSELPFEERERINYDEPSVFEHNLLRDDLFSLREGRAITTKGYDYANHCRSDSDELIEPADVVIIEGIHVFYDAAVRELLDFKLYVQVDPDVCLLRRVKRDIRDRGRSVESIYRQYLDTVKPMYEKHIRNYIEYADVIVAQGGKNAKIVDVLAHYINTRMIP